MSLIRKHVAVLQAWACLALVDNNSLGRKDVKSLAAKQLACFNQLCTNMRCYTSRFFFLY